MRGGTPAGRPESAEEPENRGAEHLFEHWTFDAISHVRFPLLMLTLLSGMIKNKQKGRAARPVKTLCIIVSYCHK